LKHKWKTWGAILCTLYLILAIAVQNRLFHTIDVQTELVLQATVSRIVDFPSSLITLIGDAEVTIPIFMVLFFFARPSHRLPLVFLFGLAIVLAIQGKTMIYQPG